MRVALTFALVAALGSGHLALAQARRTTPARRPAPPAPPKVEAAMLTCPMVLGDGIRTKRSFCDVPIGRTPAEGVIVTLPPHTGPVTLMFDLHNRHIYSEELIKTNQAYRRYMATIGVLTMDNTLISRAVVMNEFRTAADLVDRVAGGTGPAGVKAVAPTGSEPIVITLPAEAESVSILGEKLNVIRTEGLVDTFSAGGRPIAVISNVMIEYRPAPPPPPTRKPAPARR